MPGVTMPEMLADHSKRLTALEQSGVKALALDELKEAARAEAEKMFAACTENIKSAWLEGWKDLEQKFDDAIKQMADYAERIGALSAKVEKLTADLELASAKAAAADNSAKAAEIGNAELAKFQSEEAEKVRQLQADMHKAREQFQEQRGQIQVAQSSAGMRLDTLDAQMDDHDKRINALAADVQQAAIFGTVERVKALEQKIADVPAFPPGTKAEAVDNGAAGMGLVIKDAEGKVVAATL